VIEYRLAIKIDPKNAQLHRALALALSDNGDVNGAIAELLTTTKMMPRDYESKLALQALIQKRSE
jgi:Flp pilus assembly protein TadD